MPKKQSGRRDSRRKPTINDLLTLMESILQANHHLEPRLGAEILLSDTLGCGRLEMLVRGGELFPMKKWPALGEKLLRAVRGEPLQYITGAAPFMGREFISDKRAFIPRPETEELCERVLADPFWRTRPALRVADVGTGTGCLAITIALERPMAKIWATDISEDAIALARENARRYKVSRRIRWLCTDLLQGMPDSSLDLLVSNPPYVADAEWEQLHPTVRDYEPPLALKGGPDGLAVIRRVADEARRTLVPGGKIWLEIGNNQSEAVRAILLRAGFPTVQIYHDLAGHSRIVEAHRGDR